MDDKEKAIIDIDRKLYDKIQEFKNKHGLKTDSEFMTFAFNFALNTDNDPNYIIEMLKNGTYNFGPRNGVRL